MQPRFPAVERGLSPQKCVCAVLNAIEEKNLVNIFREDLRFVCANLTLDHHPQLSTNTSTTPKS